MKVVGLIVLFIVCLEAEASLSPLKFHPLPLGTIMPNGWLKNQLMIQADGLGGHLQYFWQSIANSTWIGGNVNDPGNLNERVPYWLNGMVPLVYLVNDPQLKSSVLQYVGYILDHQDADGWLGALCCDAWPTFPLLLAFTQYAEANPSDSRTVPAIWKFLRKLKTVIDTQPLHDWSAYRWQDMVLTIYWVYENYPQGNQQFLLDLANQVHSQGFNWAQFYTGANFPKVPCTGSCPNLATHGVNNGQAIKSEAVWYRYSNSPADRESTYLRIQLLDKYHGQASGIFSCSEHLAGLLPSQGSELCTVVETMFSYETIFSVFGDISHADRVESLAFNALPAAIDPSMWSHNYLQQSNQINAIHADPNIYTTDGPDSTLYGLEPNFGCCTANFVQGWPKFVTNMFMKTLDGGIAAVTYAPSTLKTPNVTIILDTDYPFGETLTFTVTSKISFPFYLRIPEWCDNATVTIGKGQAVPAAVGEFFPIQQSPGQAQYVLNLPMKFRTTRRFNQAVSIYRGPLLYSLKMNETWKQLHYYAYNSSDWEVDPQTPWAYGLNVDPANPDSSIQFVQGKVGNLPFSPNGSPVSAIAQGKQLNNWNIVKNAADAPPTSPVSSTQPLEQLTLIPFGATDLRIAEFPLLQN